MTKKHFIALADAIRECNREHQSLPLGSHNVAGFSRHQLNALADFCQSQNPHFNRERWLAYIAGECGPNGGAK